MLTVCVRYWCLLLAALLMSVSSLHLSTSVTATPALPHTALRLSDSIVQPSGLVKRSTRSFGSFYRLMQRHSRHLDEQAFVEKMFRLFDMNADNLIERDEFRAIMQLLGLISASYRK